MELVIFGFIGVIAVLNIVRAVFFRKPASAGGGMETVGWGLRGVPFAAAPSRIESDPWPCSSLANQAFAIAADTRPGSLSLNPAQPGSLPWLLREFDDHRRT
jgi:hypothetical protein